MEKNIATLFLVDGEHYPQTVLDALRYLEKKEGLRPIALYFLGGTEKLVDYSELSSYGVKIIVPSDPEGDFRAALKRTRPRLVIDLSDLPVLGPALRMRLAAMALEAGATYRGSDFEFRPPRLEKAITKPSCAVIGTGKRCGKTAVSAEMARYLSRAGHRPVIVAMGRGGPPEPYVIERTEITADYLLSEVGKGLHAASDHYEDALMAGVTTVGSRRCGGGLAGEAYVTNCVEAARLADNLDVDSVIVEGSGSSIPPVITDAGICVISAAQDTEEAVGYLGSYRLLISDGVIITMAEEPFAYPRKIKELVERVERINGDVVILRTIFRPHPLKSIRGRKVFLVTTAPEAAGVLLEGYLEEKEECTLVGRSHHLSDRGILADELRGAEKAEVMLTELKAAAVDMVTSFARAREKEVVYYHNTPISIVGERDLEGYFEGIWKKVIEKNAVR
jgi:cyclic 2,3-diphosphoglycerate synthetase